MKINNRLSYQNLLLIEIANPTQNKLLSNIERSLFKNTQFQIPSQEDFTSNFDKNKKYILS